MNNAANEKLTLTDYAHYFTSNQVPAPGGLLYNFRSFEDYVLSDSETPDWVRAVLDDDELLDCADFTDRYVRYLIDRAKKQ